MSLRPQRLALACVIVALFAPRSSQAVELSAFISGASPGDTWTKGYGGTLSTTWFHVFALEAEAAHQPGNIPDINLTSFTGSALIAPPIGFLTPYGGLGVGAYRESIVNGSDTGTLKAYIIGGKIKLAGVVVLRGEYRRIDLQSSAPIPLRHRISAGVGVVF
jgi:hypothetical protein